jgi:hypothetical protein
MAATRFAASGGVDRVGQVGDEHEYLFLSGQKKRPEDCSRGRVV